jgi:hypothetical protein
MAPPRRKAGRIQKQITSIGNAINQSNQAFKDSKRAGKPVDLSYPFNQYKRAKAKGKAKAIYSAAPNMQSPVS